MGSQLSDQCIEIAGVRGISVTAASTRIGILIHVLGFAQRLKFAQCTRPLTRIAEQTLGSDEIAQDSRSGIVLVHPGWLQGQPSHEGGPGNTGTARPPLSHFQQRVDSTRQDALAQSMGRGSVPGNACIGERVIEQSGIGDRRRVDDGYPFWIHTAVDRFRCVPHGQGHFRGRIRHSMDLRIDGCKGRVDSNSVDGYSHSGEHRPHRSRNCLGDHDDGAESGDTARNLRQFPDARDDLLGQGHDVGRPGRLAHLCAHASHESNRRGRCGGGHLRQLLQRGIIECAPSKIVHHSPEPNRRLRVIGRDAQNTARSAKCVLQDCRAHDSVTTASWRES